MKVNPLYGQNSNYTCHISDFKLSETLTASVHNQCCNLLFLASVTTARGLHVSIYHRYAGNPRMVRNVFNYNLRHAQIRLKTAKPEHRETVDCFAHDSHTEIPNCNFGTKFLNNGWPGKMLKIKTTQHGSNRLS
jgi:hypothetical protein